MILTTSLYRFEDGNFYFNLQCLFCLLSQANFMIYMRLRRWLAFKVETDNVSRRTYETEGNFQVKRRYDFYFLRCDHTKSQFEWVTFILFRINFILFKFVYFDLYIFVTDEMLLICVSFKKKTECCVAIETLHTFLAVNPKTISFVFFCLMLPRPQCVQRCLCNQ